jgi:uncharacterized repeat protein (TIGR01451 family)
MLLLILSYRNIKNLIDMKFLVIPIFIFLFFASYSQNGDCVSAIEICKKDTLQINNINGVGNNKNEILTADASCFGINTGTSLEYNSVWIKWRVAKGGSLNFIIMPDYLDDDIDFIVFKLTDNDCAKKKNVRCMATGSEPNKCALLGATGLSENETDIAEFSGCSSNQNNFLASLDMVEGENYALWINNFTSNKGVRVSFCGTALLGCELPNVGVKCLVNPQIKGNVFVDLNKDNKQGLDEKTLPNVLIQSGNDWSQFTNSFGSYSVFTDTARNYTFKPININQSDFKVVPIERNVTTTNRSLQIYGSQDFGLQPLRIFSDLRTYILAGNARPGFNSITILAYKNVGTNALNGKFSFTLDPKQEFVKSSIMPTSVVNNIYTWSIDTLKPFEQKRINIELKTKNDAPLGSFVLSKVLGNISEIDIDTSDNTQIVKIEVRGSYDPNDISVNKTNIVTKDKIALNSLDYLIKFQNTGNASALKVEVLDTLTAKLDYTSIDMLSSSHNYDMQIIESKNKVDNFTVIKWTFDNINLPDSISNEKASHGFINFRIKNNPNKMALITDSILNKAAIYFDFNPPIITNKARTIFAPIVSTIDLKDLGISIFPNPTTDILNISISNTNPKDLQIEVININGQVLRREILRGANPEMNIQELASGLYFLKIKTDEGIGVTKIFKQ